MDPAEVVRQEENDPPNVVQDEQDEVRQGDADPPRDQIPPVRDEEVEDDNGENGETLEEIERRRRQQREQVRRGDAGRREIIEGELRRMQRAVDLVRG